MKNKRGLATLPLVEYLFYMFLAVVFLGIFYWIFSLVDTSLDEDIDFGATNLQDINNKTFGQITDAFETGVDDLGIVLLISMCLLMFVNGYFVGKDHHRLFIVIDIFILIFAFILAVYLSQAYYELVSVSELSEVYLDTMPKSSSFMLNLPLWVGSIGAIIMIFSYSTIGRKEKEINVLGLQ